MKEYNFRYRRWLFWKTIKAIGHDYDDKLGMMVVLLPNGGLTTIKNWKQCELKLGSDWFIATRKEMENSIGMKIPTKIGDEK